MSRTAPAPAPRAGRVLVRAGLSLQPGFPPDRPPWRRGYGSYCIKATCELRGEDDGQPLARFMGYDRYVHIQDAVEHACRLRADEMPGVTCSAPRLTLLADYRKECAGEVYFVVDGSSRRVV